MTPDRRPAHVLVRLALAGFGICLAGTCGDAKAPSAPYPQTSLTAERGRAIPDEVLQPWMQYYGVPGVSIAVASGGALDWARGYGVADAGTRVPVTPDTIFQAASISKAMAATTALGLCDELGLDLDADVRGLLQSWRLPENAFTQRTPVTLRLLLSHSAGVNVHGFAGYDSASRQRLPSLLEILDGTPPANNEPIRVTSDPGVVYRYSGGAYQIVQQVLEDVARKGYADLVQARVFDRAGMSRSSILDPRDGSPVAAASAHDENGSVVSGRWHLYPELSAAAVWTTPTDLVRFATALQLAYRDQSEALLPAAVARTMLTAQRPTDVAGQSIALGLFLEGSGDGAYFQHGGANAGYRCYLLGYLDRPIAIAIMTNSEKGDRLLSPLLDALKRAYS
jgi:CubicO group peptidase (beta-lactamase class C family)